MRSDYFAELGLPSGETCSVDVVRTAVADRCGIKVGSVAALIKDRLSVLGASLSVAESLTGGLLSAELVNIAGISEVYRGGAVTYATDTKASVLGVDKERLLTTGPVDRVVANQMAQGVRRLFGADYGVSTTGVAGPGPSNGWPAGTVWIGLAGISGPQISVEALDHADDSKESVSIDSRSSISGFGSGKIASSNGDGSRGRDSALAWRFEIPGSRDEVRKAAVEMALSLLLLEIWTVG